MRVRHAHQLKVRSLLHSLLFSTCRCYCRAQMPLPHELAPFQHWPPLGLASWQHCCAQWPQPRRLSTMLAAKLFPARAAPLPNTYYSPFPSLSSLARPPACSASWCALTSTARGCRAQWSAWHSCWPAQALRWPSQLRMLPLRSTRRHPGRSRWGMKVPAERRGRRLGPQPPVAAAAAGTAAQPAAAPFPSFWRRRRHSPCRCRYVGLALLA